MPATEPFPWLDLDSAVLDDPAERIVRRFFDACESPEKRARTNRRLRRGARSALRGKLRYTLVNRLVSNPFTRRTGLPTRVKKMQLISAHLLGIAYMRYVFRLEPIASMPVEEIIAMCTPVVAHYLADCVPAPRSSLSSPCAFAADELLPTRCQLCSAVAV